MSMTAMFVQVEEFELKKIQLTPSTAEALFQDSPMLPPPLLNMANAMQERIKAAGPKLIADALSRMDPRVRERLEQRLGHSTADLAAGIGQDDVLKLIQDWTAPAAAVRAPASPRSTLSLDKDWHGVHFLLCGKVEPDASLLSKAVLGGTDIGDDDEGFSGYGPARYFTPQQVSEISQSLSRPELRTEAASRFDAGQMNNLKIYPGWQPSGAESLMTARDSLCNFYADAAAKGRAIVTCLV